MNRLSAVVVLFSVLIIACEYPVDEKVANKREVPGIYIANDSERRDTLVIRADGSYEERGGGRMETGIPMKGKWEMKIGRICFNGKIPSMPITWCTFAWETPTGGIKIPIFDDLGIHYVKEGKKLKGGDTADVPN